MSRPLKVSHARPTFNGCTGCNSRPLPRLFGVTPCSRFSLPLPIAGPAAADPLLDQKKAQYAKVRHQVRRARQPRRGADRAIQRRGGAAAAAAQQIKDANRRLAAAEAHLEYEQGVLAELMVARYKGLDANTLDIVLGASSLDEVTGSLDIKQRFDAAVTVRRRGDPRSRATRSPTSGRR